MKNIFNSVTVKKVARNTIYQIAGKFFTLGVTVFLTYIVTRTYGRHGYGMFNIMQTFPTLFFIIVDFGLNAIATRELSEDWSKAEKYFSNILSIRLLLSSLIILISFFVLFFFPYSGSLRIGTQLSMFLVLTQALFTTTNIIFQVKLRYDYSTIGLVGGYVLIFLIAGLASFFNLPVVWVSLSYVFGGVVTFLICLVYVKKLGVSFSFGFDKKLWKFLFLQSLPLGLMFVFSQINFKSDTILLSFLALPKRFGLDNTESVALYGLPYKIFEVSLIVATFFMNSVYPVFVRHKKKGSKELAKTFKRSLVFLLLIGVFVEVLGYIFAPFIVGFLGGDQFEKSVKVLRILLGGVFVFYLTQPFSWILVTLKKQIYLPYIYFISAVFNLILNFVFIPKYSFYASAYLTWASEILILLLLIVCTIFVWNNWINAYELKEKKKEKSKNKNKNEKVSKREHV